MLEDSMLFKIILIALLLINCILTLIMIRKKPESENWDNGFGWTDDDDYGQKTYAGCSCVGHGVKNNVNMPFNDDSNLYAKTKYQGW